MSARALTRRGLLAAAGGTGAALLLSQADRALYLPPVLRGGLVGAADALTMASQRLLMQHQPLAREYGISDITRDFPQHGETNPDVTEYQTLRASGFADWRLPIAGLVNQPTQVSLADIKRLPGRSQVTMHICEEGWSAIAEWNGARLMDVLNLAGGLKDTARYVMIDTFDDWYECFDLFDVVHPQTILAYGMNGRDLPMGNGAPLRLRVERHCGYRQLKFIKSIRAVASPAGIRGGKGSMSADYDWHWYAGA